MNQTRTRDDSDQGTRFTENLLFTQIGYQLNKHASIWLGYVHDWIAPLNRNYQPRIQVNQKIALHINKKNMGRLFLSFYFCNK
jgi:hypothetical protein